MQFDTKVRNFLVPLYIAFLNPKILSFLLFFYEKQPNSEVKSEN